MSAPLHLLAAPGRHRRLRVLRDLVATGAAIPALRRVLFDDADAEVRARAARRLAGAELPAVEGWLLDALVDPSPMVRDAVVRALAHRGTAAAVPALRERLAGDEVWWVRRAAVYALAAIAGADELPALRAALADPFWRVRHGAVRVLAVLGARDPAVRDEVVAAPPSGALSFLRATWGPAAAVDAARPPPPPSQLPAALCDPDPAVVTARLATAVVGRDVTAVALVELLAEPHAPLRALAVEHLIAAGDATAFAAALDWLEEPRVPHLADTVTWMLDRLGDAAAELATAALGRGHRPGGARWAVGWVVATGYTALHDAARACARAGTVAIRAAVLPLVDDDELVAWAAEPALRDAIAAELYRRRRDRALDGLVALDGADHPRVRALQLDVASRRGRWDVVAAGLDDPHHGPRAVAARWLTRAGDAAAQARAAADPDPAVREAALGPATAAAALADERDPWVRRAAARLLTTAPFTPAVATTIAALFADADPALRVAACDATRDPANLPAILALTLDADESVRAAACDALERFTADQVRAAMPGQPAPVRGAAYAWLLRDLDAAASATARRALADEADADVRTLLGAIAALDGAAVPSTATAVIEATVRPPRATPAPALDRRPLAGFAVAPLAISGAFDPSSQALADAEAAGVDLYFWEPGYRNLTGFLAAGRRRDHARVITGSYHAEPARIAADVDRARRRLRRDTLDVFLLFWSRSPARLDDAAFATLARLRERGLVRAIGFSTHDRPLAQAAITANPWDVVMIRHSAAHPGIEAELLPTARARRTAVITFSALCYGRMLQGPGAPSAADCYRYSLAQPGVTACISAPRRRRELVENLGALTAPPLTAAELAALRAHGVGVRAENQRFNTLLRQPTRDAAAAARELLAAEPAPVDAELPQAPLPRTSRGARSGLGGRRRRS